MYIKMIYIVFLFDDLLCVCVYISMYVYIYYNEDVNLYIVVKSIYIKTNI